MGYLFVEIKYRVTLACKMKPSLVTQMVKRLPTMQETWVRSLGWEDPLEKEMATHSSILAWKIPWTEEPGGLQSMRVAKSRTQLRDFTSLHVRLPCQRTFLEVPVVRNLPPMQEHRLKPWSGKIPHVVEQLNQLLLVLRPDSRACAVWWEGIAIRRQRRATKHNLN